MPSTIRRETRVCGIFSLPVTVVHSGEGKTIEYDINEWARRCHQPHLDSPLACPGLRRLARSALDAP